MLPEPGSPLATLTLPDLGWLSPAERGLSAEGHLWPARGNCHLVTLSLWSRRVRCAGLAVLSGVSALPGNQSPSSLLGELYAPPVLQKCHRIFCREQLCLAHLSCTICALGEVVLCCASTGQGMPAAGCGVRVTSSFLSVSAWCCLRCFSRLGERCQASIQGT